MSRRIKFTCTEPQAQFHAMTCRYPAFVGGFGSGKTRTMCYQALIDASFSKDALVCLYAPTYDLVSLILAPRLMQILEEHGIDYEYNQTKNLITTKSEQFGNFILRSLDKPERIVGYESFRAHIDEIDILPEKQANEAWNKILGRNRQKLPGIDAINRVCAYSTPEGFNFLYTRWVKNKKDGYEIVKAKTESNPFLPKDYIQSLKDSYPAELIAAYLDGEFVNLQSGTVYKSYNRFDHDSWEQIIPKEDLHIGMDFNVMKMAASVAVLRTNVAKKATAFHFVDELVNVYDTPAMIRLIKERYQGHKIVVYPDASGVSRKAVDASISDIAMLQQAGFIVKAPRKNPLVKDRILSVNKAFDDKKIFINQLRCPTISSCLEQQAYAENGEPEKKTGKDHQNDATGYLVVFNLPIRRLVYHINTQFPTKE